MRVISVVASSLTIALALSACNMRQDQAGPNSSEENGGNSAGATTSTASGAVKIDKTPLSSTPGAAPDNSQIEPRDPATR